jgi:hypothetical protein
MPILRGNSDHYPDSHSSTVTSAGKQDTIALNNPGHHFNSIFTSCSTYPTTPASTNKISTTAFILAWFNREKGS